MSASVQRKLEQAHQSLASGKVAAAVSLCENVLERAPRNPEALWMLGNARLMEGRAELAVAILERAVAAAPDRGSALESLGLAYLMAGNLAAGEHVLRQALALPHAPLSVRMRLGAALVHQGKHEEAIYELEGVLEHDPEDADARLNLGRAYAGTARWSEAARAFEHVVSRVPHHADALYNLGIASVETGGTDRARSCFERLLARDPEAVEARERLATLLLTLGRYAEAITQLREIVRANAGASAAQARLAEALFQTGALDEAAQIATTAIHRQPVAPGASSVLAQIHYVRGEMALAAGVLEEGYRQTAARPLLAFSMHLFHRMCEWDKWQSAWARMAGFLDTAEDLGSPFWLLSEMTSPEQQLSYTRRWAAARFHNFRAVSSASSPGKRDGGRRLRVGYLSSDFHDHAVAHLLVEVLERHDREQFEIYAYSYGPDDGSTVRARLRAGIEHFCDVAWEPDDAVVTRIRADDLDLLVDLRGYTAGDRLQIMARRPAPVQVTWLGYPGTTGADFIDYIIADDYIIPRDAERFYSERVLRMPVCYQPNDRKRQIAQPLTRTQYGLPEDAFVFCCFTQGVKILPEVFACWMRLLSRIPGSVLWLLDDNLWANANLAKAAAQAGINAERLIPAPRLPNDQHLARFGAADLALDTFPYTSHTTASDALWMGCPLVALCGETFAARVSASIVSACGFPELVTTTLEAYEALAYRVATDAVLRKDVTARIVASRDTSPLFDSQKFARDLEALYMKISR